jgi:CubicO group peptidase (beta-lactamase class C family)
MLRFPLVPRLPFVPDPLRRCRVPRDLGTVTTVGDEVDPTSVDLEADAIEAIWGSVEDLYRSGIHPAISVCLRRHGEVVLDRAIGHSHGNGPNSSKDEPVRLATPATPFVLYSASKAITAMVVHLLDQQGVLHIGDRVCDYVPEFGTGGKEAITIGHVLAHRAGVPSVPREAMDLDNLERRDVIIRLLADAKLTSRPGRALAYHAVSGGFILGEVVHRATGRTIREVLHDEILEPLGFRWMNYGVDRSDLDAVATDHLTGLPVVPPISWVMERALGMPFAKVVDAGNDERLRTGIVPAGNVIATANELSRFYELLRRGGELDGVRIFEPRTIRRATSEQSYHEIDLTLGLPQRFSLGFMLGSRYLSLYGFDTLHAFGHLGFTNIVGWADPERALSGAILTSGKPVLYPEIFVLLSLLRNIGTRFDKVALPA